jgi:hypothetical protein
MPTPPTKGWAILIQELVTPLLSIAEQPLALLCFPCIARVAKLLQFCPLLPENSSAIATIAGATLEDKLCLRRAWRNPGSPSQWSSESYELAGMDPSLAAQQPAGSQQGSSTSSESDQHPVDSSCEVQLIMGKTLERNLGREAAIDLMDRIR